MKKNYDSINILGVDVNIVSISDVLTEVEYAIQNGESLTFSAVNPHKLNMTSSDKDFKDTYSKFDLVAPDSTGTLLAGRFLSGGFKGERVSGDKLAPHLFNLSEDMDISFFFLGASEDIVRKAKTKITSNNPDLNVVGVHNGYFKTEGPENDRIVNIINHSKANVIFVGMGSPKQEKWICENFNSLEVNAAITMGGYFDLVVKRIDCYPSLVDTFKLNWLYRLLQEPRRLWRRYLFQTPVFFANVTKQKFQSSWRTKDE